MPAQWHKLVRFGFGAHMHSSPCVPSLSYVGACPQFSLAGANRFSISLHLGATGCREAVECGRCLQVSALQSRHGQLVRLPYVQRACMPHQAQPPDSGCPAGMFQKSGILGCSSCFSARLSITVATTCYSGPKQKGRPGVFSPRRAHPFYVQCPSGQHAGQGTAA